MVKVESISKGKGEMSKRTEKQSIGNGGRQEGQKRKQVKKKKVRVGRGNEMEGKGKMKSGR